MFVISIKDNVTAKVKSIGEALKPSNINPAIGAAEVRLFQEHFAKLPPNKEGFPTQHYWGRAAKSTHYTVLADGVMVSVSTPGINMHATGLPKVIRPINAANLAIPAVPQAAGKSPREFSNLRVAFYRKGGQLIAFALVEKGDASTRGGEHPVRFKGYRGSLKNSGLKARAGTVIFWLHKEVHPRAYPGVVPDESEMRRTAVIVAEQQIEQAKLIS